MANETWLAASSLPSDDPRMVEGPEPQGHRGVGSSRSDLCRRARSRTCHETLPVQRLPPPWRRLRGKVRGLHGGEGDRGGVLDVYTGTQRFRRVVVPTAPASPPSLAEALAEDTRRVPSCRTLRCPVLGAVPSAPHHVLLSSLHSNVVRCGLAGCHRSHSIKGTVLARCHNLAPEDGILLVCALRVEVGDAAPCHPSPLVRATSPGAPADPARAPP
mmetsp:Transcript_137022/g.292663  ORF Transcript_137022/g.292663 Transcript_137022/m.292663 type:complete len:216 (+) Transcript_137022:26-673(+)